MPQTAPLRLRNAIDAKTSQLTFAMILLTSALTGCILDDGTMPDTNAGDTAETTTTGEALVARARISIRDNISRQLRPLGNLRIVRGTAPATPAQCATTTVRTNATGDFEVRGISHVSLCLANEVVAFLPVAAQVVVEREAAKYANILRYALSWNDSTTTGPTAPISLNAREREIPATFAAPLDTFERTLARNLLRYRRKVAAIMAPSVGLNLGSVGTQTPLVGESVLFADVFRTARPFAELAPAGVTIPVDANGWPTAVPANVVVITSFLQGQGQGVPAGQYTVLYDGNGNMSYGGIARLVSRSPGRDIITITPTNGDQNQAFLRINQTTAGNHIRNIRVVMPGGTCKIDPRVYVQDAASCAVGDYVSFETQLRANRNAMVFYPETLWFLKDFATVRFAKTMEVSPQAPDECKNPDGSVKATCTAHTLTWSNRPNMSALGFGSPGAMTYEQTRPVPVEAVVALANAAGVAPWISVPPHASNDYLEGLAAYLKANVPANKQIALELGSETWNAHYLAAHYLRAAGLARGYGGGDATRAGNEYYVRRSLEMFGIFERVFGAQSPARLYRMLNGDHRNLALTQELLGYTPAGKVDGFGIAPYFYGCYKPVWPQACTDRALTPFTYFTATTVDQVFAMINNPQDPFGLDALFANVTAQANAVQARGLDLVMYEGGQSLRPFMVDVGDAAQNQQLRARLTPLFTNANRDPKMATLYTAFLERWRAVGGVRPVLYSSPRTASMFDAFGLAEHVSATRAVAPKYRAVMTTQEAWGKCWWPGC